MKILYLCHRFPFPPASGAKIRPFHTIRHLGSSHEVTVLSLVRSDVEADEGTGIASHCARFEMFRVTDAVQAMRMVAGVPRGMPATIGFFYSPEMARRVQVLLERERFDLILAHSSSVAQYVMRTTGVPKIMDFCDMDSQKWLAYARHKPFPVSLAYMLEGRRLERDEQRIAARFDVCTVATRTELATLERCRAGGAVDWFSNGVDTDYFAPSDQPFDVDSLVFVGRMDYYPNEECMVDFCERVLPRLQAVRQAVRLTIVGANPTRVIRKLSNLAGVTVTGTVPDVRPYLRRAAVMVAPLSIARGTQNKILEGMASGVPVVTSHLAAGGVDAVAPDHLLTATTSDEYQAAILRVLNNAAERARLARAGRERMLSHHAWAQSMRRLDGIVERCLATARPSRQGASKLTEATSN